MKAYYGAEELIPEQYIVVFKDQWEGQINSEVAQQALSFVNAKTEAVGIAEKDVKNRYENALRGFTAKLSETQLQTLQKDPAVDFIEQDRYYNGLEGTVSIPTTRFSTFLNFFFRRSQTMPWGITRVGGSLDGTGKKAWILDTGIDLDNSDLTVDVGNSISFVGGESADDLNGHGTHVAGILAAKNNSTGVVGVAAGATVVSVKVLPQSGTGTLSDLVDGINYAAGKASSNDIINLSLSSGVSSSVDNAVINAANSGLRFALAAGNQSSSATTRSPARVSHSNVWTVSGYDINDDWYSNSNYGNPPIDYSGPGVDVLSLWKNGGTNTISCTSMATPHIAGLLLAASTIYTDGYVSGDPDATADAIASSEITVETPNVTGSIQSNHPKLSWQTCDNADEYEIWRKVESSGSWTLWTTVSATNYTDFSITDPDMTISIPSGSYDWVAYKVKAVHDDGFESFNSSIIYFETDSIFPE